MLARVLSLATAFVLACGMISPLYAQEPVTVFAAASLKNALEAAGRAFTAETAIPVRFSFAASSALARQIEQGAPADLFASADRDWMDYLGENRLVRPDTRTDLLGNRLVLIVPRDSAVRDLPLTAESLRQVLGPDGRLATGEVSSVPIGRYAKSAFDTAGLWPDIHPRLAQTENARAALLLVSRGETPLGVVYETDARADPGVRVVARFPPDSHPPVIYPFAVTAGSAHPGALRFLGFLKSPAARPFFEAQGFTMHTPDRSGPSHGQ